MEKNTWQIIAIVFIILFVVQTAFVIWIYNVGNKIVDGEITCSNECSYRNYIYYNYNDLGDCSCYDEQNVLGYRFNSIR